MATATSTTVDIDGDGSTNFITWDLTTANPDGAPVSWVQWADRSITFVGTWGGATAALEGSNDGSVWLPITDPQGNAISKTANGLEAATELTRFVRPNLTTVGVGATIKATLVMRRAQPLRT